MFHRSRVGDFHLVALILVSKSVVHSVLRNSSCFLIGIKKKKCKVNFLPLSKIFAGARFNQKSISIKTIKLLCSWTVSSIYDFRFLLTKTHIHACLDLMLTCKSSFSFAWQCTKSADAVTRYLLGDFCQILCTHTRVWGAKSVRHFLHKLNNGLHAAILNYAVKL